MIVYFEAVRPDFIMLTADNPLAKYIQIDCTVIGVELTDMGHNGNDHTNLQTNTVITNNIQDTHENAAHPCNTNLLNY